MLTAVPRHWEAFSDAREKMQAPRQQVVPSRAARGLDTAGSTPEGRAPVEGAAALSGKNVRNPGHPSRQERDPELAHQESRMGLGGDTFSLGRLSRV